MRLDRRGSPDDPPLTEAPLTLDELLQSSADSVLLAYLSVVISMLALFALIFWRTMQPTILGSAPIESASKRNVAFHFLATHDTSERAERLATETADQENRRRQSDELESSGTVGMRAVEAPVAGPSPVKQSVKPRPAVRNRGRDIGPTYHDPWQAWAGARSRNQWDRNRAWSYDGRERGRNGRAWNW